MADPFQPTISTGDILAEAGALFARNRVLVVLAAALLAGELFAFDMLLQWLGLGRPGTHALYSLANIPLRLLTDYTVAALLIASEQLNPRRWSIMSLLSYAVLSTLAGLAMLVGFAALIVPGVVLAIRWSIAGNFAIARGLGPVDSVRASWRATRGSAGGIFGALALVGMISVIGVFALSGHLGSTPAQLPPGMVMVRDVFTGLTGAAGACINVAIYALLAGAQDKTIGNVFD